MEYFQSILIILERNIELTDREKVQVSMDSTVTEVIRHPQTPFRHMSRRTFEGRYSLLSGYGAHP
jgi:hypothetical protein